YSLDQHVANGGSLRRPGNYLAPDRIGGKLIEERVLAATANDVQTRDRPTGELLHFFKSHAVIQRQAFKDAARELTRGFGRGLARFQTIGKNFLRHITRLHESLSSRVDQRSESLRCLCLPGQSGIVELKTLSRPLATRFLQNPKSHNILQKPGCTAVAGF